MMDKDFRYGKQGSRHWVGIHAKFLSEVGLSIYPWLMKHGVEFPDPTARPKSVRKGRMKYCFTNAFRVADRNRGKYHYCEGFAIPKDMFPMEHAWCIDNEGNVIDPTWDDALDYFGVAFRMEFVRSEVVRTEHYGILHMRPNLALFSDPNLCKNSLIHKKVSEKKQKELTPRRVLE